MSDQRLGQRSVAVKVRRKLLTGRLRRSLEQHDLLHLGSQLRTPNRSSRSILSITICAYSQPMLPVVIPQNPSPVTMSLDVRYDSSFWFSLIRLVPVLSSMALECLAQ